MMSTGGSVTTTHEELRASARIEVDLEARIEVAGELIPCALRNISRGGAFADAVGVGYGTEVTLWFKVPMSQVIVEIAAVVRWSTPEGIGLQFGSLRARDAWALGRYLEALRDARRRQAGSASDG